ncbi:YdcF family protein [Herpetosiphon geysericola]|uniref:DUF218 domain-containing protein n=1 Tax=Herpetosiphon geysericola TaxID=70996 RepID=A0A0P6XE59_9CHLR|nr:YdcF family protein [Herpetosiphon geysericola]KPL81294.1 hypothetical protein SE18_21725 [Herpetosiphon geysericola]
MQSPAKQWLRRSLRGLFASICLASVLFISTGYIVARQADRAELRPVDALLVLGAAQWDGEPSPVLEARLTEAIRLYRLGYARRIIVSGGTGLNDTRSEASVAYDFLIEQSIDPTLIISVAQGSDTRTTLLAVRDEMQRQQIDSLLIVTDPPHLLRALKMAHDYGITSFGAPVKANTPTTNWASIKATSRETLAYLAYVLLDQ